MPANICLVFLILCGIWSQGIIGSFAEENNTESSRFLVRRKRVISYVPGEDRPVLIEGHPYIVIIKQLNRIHCVGTILSHRVVITAAACAQSDKSNYKLVTSSSHSNRVVRAHNVTDIKKNCGNHPNRPEDGIALFTIDPAIVYNTREKKIDLHVEPVLPRTIGTVSGWGYNVRNVADPGTKFPMELRSIEVPILAHQQCVILYRAFFHISDHDICTFHPLKRAAYHDVGAPLVIDNLLVGIFLRRGPTQIPFRVGYPDVFAFLQHTDYHRWIMANI